MPDKIKVQCLGISEAEVQNDVNALLAPYGKEAELKEFPKPKDTAPQGVIVTVLITLVVEPFVKSTVEFVAKEFCSKVKEMIQRWRAKHSMLTGTILLKKDEADEGTAINPEANERYFEELWSGYAEELTKKAGK